MVLRRGLVLSPRLHAAQPSWGPRSGPARRRARTAAFDVVRARDRQGCPEEAQQGTPTPGPGCLGRRCGLSVQVLVSLGIPPDHQPVAIVVGDHAVPERRPPARVPRRRPEVSACAGHALGGGLPLQLGSERQNVGDQLRYLRGHVEHERPADPGAERSGSSSAHEPTPPARTCRASGAQPGRGGPTR